MQINLRHQPAYTVARVQLDPNEALQLEAGAMNVQQARAQIIALNARTEALIAQTTMAQAQGMGRTLNPTMIPTLNQPVVSASGKSNMRELFKKSKTKDFIDKIARQLGVRTSGAGYNIETTIPKRFAKGGVVYRAEGSDGPEFKPMGTDTVPAMLTPGEFVINAKAAKKFSPLLQAINSNRMVHLATGGPIDTSMVSTHSNTVSPMSTPEKSKPTQQVFQINITGDVSRQTRAEIQRMLPNIANGVNSYNKEKG